MTEPQTAPTPPTDEEQVERIALALRVLFPNEAWTTYVGAAHCILHEVKR